MIGRALRRPRSALRQVGIALLALLGGWCWGALSLPSPVRIVDLHELDGVAVRGGVLDLIATIDQQRLCTTSVRRWLWRPDPELPGAVEWVYLPDVPFKPPIVAGQDRYRLRIPVPAWVEQGDWHYLGEPDDQCSPFAAWFKTQRLSPDVMVHIANPSAANPAEIVSPPGAVTVVPSDSKPEGTSP